MVNKKSINFDDNELKAGSRNLRYHIKMYVETFNWLHNNIYANIWNMERNAILENHLVHARVLINFIIKDKSTYDGDVFAVYYIHEWIFECSETDCNYLNNIALKIGGSLVHLTKVSMSTKKSEIEWPIRKIAEKLIPYLIKFLEKVPERGFEFEVRRDCIKYLKGLTTENFPFTLSPTT